MERIGLPAGAMPYAAIAFAGDVVALLLFPVLGAAGHENGIAASTYLRTTLPFTVAWAVVGVALGSFQPGAAGSLQGVLKRVLPAWLIAGFAAIGLRSLIFSRPFDLAFAAVAIGVTGALVLGWRLALAIVWSRKSA